MGIDISEYTDEMLDLLPKAQADAERARRAGVAPGTIPMTPELNKIIEDIGEANLPKKLLKTIKSLRDPTKKEEEFKIKFNLEHKLDNYSYISVSSTFETTSNAELLINKIKQKDTDNMKWLYYGEVPLKESKLSFLNGIEIKPMNLTIREQQTLKINAKYNFGNETGMNLWTPKYSKTYVIGNKSYGPVHGGKNEGKLRRRPFKSGNFINKVEYL